MENGLLIIGILFIVIFIAAVSKKVEWIINFILRTVLGVLLIFFANKAIAYFGFSAFVGINPATVLTCGFLGIPGVVALFAIVFCRFL